MRFIAISLFLLHCLSSPLRGEIVDRIVAVVDNQVVSSSAALDEANYQAFRNEREPVAILEGEALRKIVSQMIDQELLEKEIKAGLFTAQSAEVQKEIEAIQARFANQQAYEQALGRYKLTDAGLALRLQRERDILAFIDFRLRPQVSVTPDMVQAYYKNTLLAELGQRGQSETPRLEDVHGQIEQVLVQQEINRLLEPWLQELRRRAKIKMRM